jgi:putative ABC transport system permease protein
MRWLQRLFHKSQAAKELDKELRFHLEQQIVDDVAAGIDPQEARRRAQLSLGGIERVKEEVRDSHWEAYIEDCFRDFRYALGSLRKDSSMSLVAIFALALGICASTVVFSVVYNVFVHALPYKDFNRSVVFELRNLVSEGGWKGRNYFFAEEVRAFREKNRVFEDMIAHEGIRPLYDNGKYVRYWPFGQIVSANTFDYLGVAPLLGRAITLEDGKPSAPLIFVMSYRLWKRDFAGDPRILGKTFILNGKSRTLVGIMPPQFHAFDASFWMPDNPGNGSRDTLAGGAQLIGRMKPGVTVKMAAADLNVIGHEMPRNAAAFFPEKFAIVPHRWLDSLIGNFRQALYALLAAVFPLVLIACTNVANLLLARATTRERELAMRATLGATRGRLVRQLLTESFILAGIAAGAGCVLAYFVLKAAVALIPAGTLPEETVIQLNAPVLMLCVGITVLTAVLCGLAPALHVWSSDLQPRLTGSAKGSGGSIRHGRLRSGLVVSEVALSMVLLIGAGLLLRSFFVLTRVDLGFDPQNILYFRLELPQTYNTDVPGSPQKNNELTRQLLERVRALPGVKDVSECIEPPPLQDGWSDTIIPGRPHTERWETRVESVSDGYLEMLGLPLIRGRYINQDDVSAARYVMVINEAFARQFFPNLNPIGHKVKLEVLDRPFLAAPHDTYFEIVGVVRSYKMRNEESRTWESIPDVFFPYSVQGYSWRTYLARTEVDPNSLWKSIEQEVRSLDPSLGIAATGTLEGALKEFYRAPKFELVTFAAFATAGLLLVEIGIFSVMAYTVSLRTHEVGVRMALGAQQPNILRLILLHGFRCIALGSFLGLFASYVFSRFLTSQISGVSATDPWTFAVVTALVVSVGLGACLLPARRAASVDPVIALRYE